MAKNLANAFPPDFLVGAAHLYQPATEPRSVARHFRNLLQERARARVAGLNAADLVDNGGGTAPVQYTQADSGVLADNDLTGLTTGVTSASLNTAADTVMNAYAVLMERVNAVAAVLGMGSGDEGPGTIASSGTVAVIDDSASANSNNTDAATTATARLVQRDLLHAQRVLILAVDDIRVAVGLERQVPKGPGVWDGTGNLTFADADPDTITRSSGSWVDDGFMPGDVIRSSGSGDNNGYYTIASMTALALTLISGDALTAEVITAATEGRTYDLRTVSRPSFPGRLAGPNALDVDGPASPAGSDWTLSFETGTSAISNASDGSDATSAILLADWDAFVDELSDNFALIADLIDEVTAKAAVVTTSIPYFIDQTAYAAGTSVFVTSPVSGRLRNNRVVVVDEQTAGEQTITLEIEGSAVSGASITVSTTTDIGVSASDAIADTGNPGAATANYVEKGQQIEIVITNTPTAGAVIGWLDVVETGETDEDLAGYAA